MKILFCILITTLIVSCWAERSGLIEGPTQSSIFRNNTDCHCVPFELCRSSIGLRSCKYLEVCCNPFNITQPKTNTNPENINPYTHTSCGQRNTFGIGMNRSKNDEAKFGEFPWMVAILKEETIGKNGVLSNNVYLCGGALIHPSVVLTVAHCVAQHNETVSALKVRAGEWDLLRTNETSPHQDRQVAKLILHENYLAHIMYNDFALLRLTEPINIADNVNVVCLPERNTNLDYDRCIATGWGTNLLDDKLHDHAILKKVHLSVVPSKKCRDLLRNTWLGNQFQFHDSFTCAGDEYGRDTCKDDGGSPLVCPIQGDPNNYYQVGITSWRIDCGTSQVPGVYANVIFARSWMDQKMAHWGFYKHLQ